MRTKPKARKTRTEYFAQAIKQLGSQQAIEEQLKAAGKTFDGWRTEMTQQTTATGGDDPRFERGAGGCRSYKILR